MLFWKEFAKQILLKQSLTRIKNINFALLHRVQQGSLISPTSFHLFFNGFRFYFNRCFSDVYADDTAIDNHGKMLIWCIFVI